MMLLVFELNSTTKVKECADREDAAGQADAWIAEARKLGYKHAEFRLSYYEVLRSERVKVQYREDERIVTAGA